MKTSIFILLFTICVAQPKSEFRRVVVLGDSLTEGYGINKSKAYPALIEKELQKTYNVQIMNAGISGSTTSSALSRLKTLLPSKPNVLVLALGSNDGLRGIDPQLSYKNLEEAIALAKKNKIKVLLLGAKVPPNYGKTYSDKFDKIFTDLAKKHKVEFIPFILNKVAGKPELIQEDGLHPNEAGHQIMATEIGPRIQQML